MKFDLMGRLENLRLPDGKTAILYSVYEAVSNSVHAIQDHFGSREIAKQGLIEIEVAPNRQAGTLSQIVVRDNGIGLDEVNLAAFDTSDSRRKFKDGGKGVGRLIWLKVFDHIHVESTFVDRKKKVRSIQFNFVADQNKSLQDMREKSAKSKNVGTQITFGGIRSSHNAKIKRASLMRDLALHFFSYFIAKSMPKVTVAFGSTDAVDLGEYIESRIEEPQIEKIGLPKIGKGAEIEVVHLFVDKNISRNLRNSIHLVAHNRQVHQIEIAKKFALNQLAKGRAYIALVRGKFLDDKVDQERTGFKFTPEQYDAVHEAVLESAERFLRDHIQKIRVGQKVIVNSLLVEHPQLAGKVGNIDSYVSKLSASMGDEEIGKTLFTLLYRDERKLATEVRQFSKLENLSQAAEQRAQKTLAQITEQAKMRLAEYVVKRQQILEIAKSFLRHRADKQGKYHYEKVIHDLICPMGSFFDGGESEAHNLWLIDDLLAYYEFFASDKKLSVVTKKQKDRGEPDVVFFNPMGFRREGTNEPVVLVEFKRPGNEKLSSDPVGQILGYVETLRDKTITHPVTGAVISKIRQGTPFECYVICELTESMRKVLSHSAASTQTPDGEGFFGYASNHQAAIHVISYQKMLHDAELRNQILFKKLGLVTS